MVTWPVLPGVGIGAQAWPNLALGSLGSSSTKPFKLYLHWDFSFLKITRKSKNLSTSVWYWGKKSDRSSEQKCATISTKLLSLVECSLQGQHMSQRAHVPRRVIFPRPTHCPQMYKPGDKVVQESSSQDKTVSIRNPTGQESIVSQVKKFTIWRKNNERRTMTI